MAAQRKYADVLQREEQPIPDVYPNNNCPATIQSARAMAVLKTLMAPCDLLKGTRRNKESGPREFQSGAAYRLTERSDLAIQ